MHAELAWLHSHRAPRDRRRAQRVFRAPRTNAQHIKAGPRKPNSAFTSRRTEAIKCCHSIDLCFATVGKDFRSRLSAQLDGITDGSVQASALQRAVDRSSSSFFHSADTELRGRDRDRAWQSSPAWIRKKTTLVSKSSVIWAVPDVITMAVVR